jgi:hypothetical protein
VTATAPVVAQPSLERLLRRVGIPPESIHPREDGGVDGLHEKRYDISETLHNLNLKDRAVMFHSESWRAMSNEEAGMHYPTGPNKSSLLRRVGIPPESILHPREDGGVDDLHEKRYDISETLHNILAVYQRASEVFRVMVGQLQVQWPCEQEGGLAVTIGVAER